VSVRLFARGSDGVVAITDGGITDATLTDYLSNPFKNIDNIYFHSDFDYMSLAAKFSTTITFQARSASSVTVEYNKGKDTYQQQVPDSGYVRHDLGTHNLGYTPFATATRGSVGSQVTPTFPIQENGAALRFINIEMDASKIYVYEYWVTFTNALSAVTEDFDVWVFRNPA
jgi:hypothetical protein